MTSVTVSGQPSLVTRVTQWTLLRVLFYLAAIISPVVGFEWAIHVFIPGVPSPLHTPLRMAANLVGPLLALGIYRMLVHLFERREAVEIGIRQGAVPFLIGILLGAALICATYLVLWSLGIAHFETGDAPDQILTGLIVFFCVGVFEELLMRAVVFRILEEAGGTTVAILISSMLFGLAHVFNPDATLVSTVQIALEAGILLALAFALTRNLWLAVGIHMGWNYAQGNIFGGAVSGGEVPHSLFKSVLTGPEYLTGGAFGLEASVVALGVCLVAASGLAVLVARRGEWRPMTRFRFSLP